MYLLSSHFRAIASSSFCLDCMSHLLFNSPYCRKFTIWTSFDHVISIGIISTMCILFGGFNPAATSGFVTELLEGRVFSGWSLSCTLSPAMSTPGSSWPTCGRCSGSERLKRVETCGCPHASLIFWSSSDGHLKTLNFKLDLRWRSLETYRTFWICRKMQPNGSTVFCGLCFRHGLHLKIWVSVTRVIFAAGPFWQDLILKPLLVALILTTMSSLLLCCRPSLKRSGV